MKKIIVAIFLLSSCTEEYKFQTIESPVILLGKGSVCGDFDQAITVMDGRGYVFTFDGPVARSFFSRQIGDTLK